jgi:hypothetical protein
VRPSRWLVFTLFVLVIAASVRSSPVLSQRSTSCPEGQVSVRGHCCASGQQWVAARQACAYVLADRCPSGTTRADSTTCCARAHGGGPADCFSRGVIDPDTSAIDCPPGMLMAVNDARHGVWCVRAPTDRIVSLTCGDHTDGFAIAMRFFADPATQGGRVEVRYPRTAEPITGTWGYYSATADGQAVVFVHTPLTMWTVPFARTAPGTAITGAHRVRGNDGSDVSCSGSFEALDAQPPAGPVCASGTIPRSDGTTCDPGLVGRTLVADCGGLTTRFSLAAGGHASLDDADALLWSAHEVEHGGGVLVQIGYPSDAFPPSGWSFLLARTAPGATLIGTEGQSQLPCTGHVEAGGTPPSSPPSSPPPAPPATSSPPPAPPAPPPPAVTPTPPATASGASLAETNEWIRSHMVGMGFLVSGLRPGTAYPDIEAFAITAAQLDGCNVTIERTSLYASLFVVPSVGNRWQADHAWSDRMTFSWGSLVPGSVATHVEWTPAASGAVSYLEVQARGASVSFHPLPTVPAWLPPAIHAHPHTYISAPDAIVPQLGGWFAAARTDGTRSTVALVFEHGDETWQARAVDAVRHAIELCGGHADTF